jgi:hypothetical protein
MEQLYKWARERAIVFQIVREHRNLTRAQMAELLGPPTTVFMVSVLERGDPGRIRESKLTQIAEAYRRLGVS